MNLNRIKNLMNSEEYDFLRKNEHLGDNIILLGLGGSYSYGTNNEHSDLDLRGIALPGKREILLGNSFEQVIDEKTDTVVYSLKKIIPLLTACNPNAIEILGLKEEHYLYVSEIGRELLDNKEMFLSQKAIGAFGGYANQQLYRMNQKATQKMNQTKLEEHILRTLQSMQESFKDKYTNYADDGIKLYIDKAVQSDFDTEIFMDICLTHYPLRDYKNMWEELHQTVKSYSNVGKRNKNAIEHDKLGKHMMHLVRLYYMCFDILEKGEIHTFREKEHDLLMSIRNGIYLDSNHMPVPEFYEFVRELELRLEYDKKNTFLPEEPDDKRIEDFVCSVNEKIVKQKITNR